jgi:transaldolase
MRIEVGASRLYDLQGFGQSVWLDCNHPRSLASPGFPHLIRDGIAGVDSNLVGLAAAYAEDSTYRESIAGLSAAGATPRQIYEHLSIEDLRHAADCLRRVYNNSSGRDGYVSVDLAPSLADDADGTESEAVHLWSVIDRPNIMIKVPATDAGLLAMRRLISAGLNVNATLIFGARRYRAVIDAYLGALEKRVAEGLPLGSVASVASVFLGPIDSAVNRELDAIQQPAKAAHAKRLRGKAAVAVAQFVYQRYRSVVASPRWQPLAAHHAKTQRLLWASTDINDAADSDVKYVNDLIGRDTVMTMSLNTLSAYLDHGAATPTLERNLLEVLALFGELEALGIDLDRVSTQLERENIDVISAGVNTALTRLSPAA